ncbi:MAG: flagellar biosynthesis anti-sigma factor FlgM [Gallionellales bacterium RIFOXYB12_FULL_54_9]|nr:MAG: flagellar biosynthesis anti-sigma factor FlgM [Gallionellales bacterium RIFOXYB12_FULL_54_9]
MKIDKLGQPLPSTPASEANTRATKGGTGTAPQASTSVTLGSTATQLGKMEASMASSPVIDDKKVAEIKQAISEGRFQVNSGMVADRLIQSVRDLISNSNQR